MSLSVYIHMCVTTKYCYRVVPLSTILHPHTVHKDNVFSIIFMYIFSGTYHFIYKIYASQRAKGDIIVTCLSFTHSWMIIQWVVIILYVVP